MLPLVLAFLLGGLLVGSIFLLIAKSHKAKPVSKKNISYGYTKLDRETAYTIHDHMGHPWILVRFGIAGAHCVQEEYTHVIDQRIRWSQIDEKWFSWDKFQNQFPEHADLGPEEILDSNQFIKESLTPDEAALLTDYRNAQKEISETFKA